MISTINHILGPKFSEVRCKTDGQDLISVATKWVKFSQMQGLKVGYNKPKALCS